jgi:hypothetical protein
VAGLCVTAILLIAGTAATGWADDAEMKARMAELERENHEMREEMREMRELLESTLGKKPPAAPVQAGAEAAPPAGEGRVEEVERRQSVITEEVRKIKEALVLPETAELKSEYGLGPAASKVYNVTRGVSLGGYGEFNYRGITSDHNGAESEFDMLRLVLYTGYKFNDWLLFNSEVEFEHQLTGEDGDGEVKVEFANIDVLLHPMANIRAGLLLMPMGFINEVHEPPFFHGNVRPMVERNILPATWSAGGAGLFGELAPGLSYRTYAVVGMNAEGFSSSGLRGGRQEGIETAEDFAWVGRMDYSPLEMLSVGGSAYLGNSGQDHEYGDPNDLKKPDVFTQIYEAHAQLRTHGVEARLLGAYSEIDDAAVLSLADPANPVSSSQWGWYGEIAYNVLPLVCDTNHYLAPWFRYSMYDTQDDVPSGFVDDTNQDRDIYEVGLTYKPIPQVVFKLDYRNQDSDDGSVPDEVRLGAGFAY